MKWFIIIGIHIDEKVPCLNIFHPFNCLFLTFYKLFCNLYIFMEFLNFIISYFFEDSPSQIKQIYKTNKKKKLKEMPPVCQKIQRLRKPLIVTINSALIFLLFYHTFYPGEPKRHLKSRCFFGLTIFVCLSFCSS